MKRKELHKKLEVRHLRGPDLRKGFIETLEELAPVELPELGLGEIFRGRLNWRIVTYAALLDDEVIGTASVFYELKFIHGGGKVAHVEDVAVRKKYQKHGVGRALMDLVEKEAIEAGCYKIIPDCSKKNRKFYERLGYHKHGVEMRKDLKCAT